MRIWCTTIYAKCAVTGQLKTFCGPNIEAPSAKLAHEYCQNNGLGYCHIEGELQSETPCKPHTFDPDWDKEIDYTKKNQN